MTSVAPVGNGGVGGGWGAAVAAKGQVVASAVIHISAVLVGHQAGAAQVVAVEIEKAITGG